MKGFIRGLLTIFIMISLIIFGLVNSIKEVMVDATEKTVKREIKTGVLDIVENYVQDTESVSEEVISKVEEEIDKNPNIKKLMDDYYDKIIGVLSGKEESIEIDAVKEIENLINDSEEILNDYGVTLTEEDKKEMLSVVSSSEVNTIVNDAIVDVKNNMSSDVKAVINTYAFLISGTFKIVLVAMVVVSLVFIALLKKSFYRWLTNLGIASLVSGVVVGVILPMIISVIIEGVASDGGLEVTTSSLNTYGYGLIILGVVAIIGNIIISKIENKRNMSDKEVEVAG